MNSIKPIETAYNGYLFRSRLEARWAVFFDSLGIRYEYEAEGYDLPPLPKQEALIADINNEFGTIRYLPDFYLSDLDLFVEVKGRALSEKEWGKVVRLAYGSRKRVALLGSIPHIKNGRVCYQDDGYSGNILFLLGADIDYYFCECPACGMVDFQYTGLVDRIKCSCPKGRVVYNSASPRLTQAYQRASMARF